MLNLAINLYRYLVMHKNILVIKLKRQFTLPFLLRNVFQFIFCFQRGHMPNTLLSLLLSTN